MSWVGAPELSRDLQDKVDIKAVSTSSWYPMSRQEAANNTDPARSNACGRVFLFLRRSSRTAGYGIDSRQAGGDVNVHSAAALDMQVILTGAT